MDCGLATRERILRAAAECFSKNGFERTRMVNVALAAGLSRAALYTHFPGKGELVRALNDYVISEWRDWMQESVAVARTTSEAVELWLRGGLADSWRVTVAQVVSSEGVQGELLTDRGATRDALTATRRLLSGVLKRGVESGELRADLDVTSTAHALQAVLMGLLRNHASERPIVAIERRRDLDALVDLVLQGLRRPS